MRYLGVIPGGNFNPQTVSVINFWQICSFSAYIYDENAFSNVKKPHDKHTLVFCCFFDVLIWEKKHVEGTCPPPHPWDQHLCLHLYLQTFDRVLVGHGSGLQQQFCWRHIIIRDGKEESWLPLIIVAAANPGVEHVVGVVPCVQQYLIGVWRWGNIQTGNFCTSNKKKSF